MKFIPFKAIPMCLLVFCVFTACNNRQYVLEYKLPAGMAYTQHVEISTDSKQQMNDEVLETKSTIQMVLSSGVSSIQDSVTIIRTCYNYISQTWNMGVMESGFNSGDTTASATLGNPSPLLRVIKDIPFNATINRQGRVNSIHGFDTVYTAWQNTVDVNETFKEQAIAVVEKDFGFNAFKTTIGRFTAIFPNRPVKTGDTWNIIDKYYGSYVITVNGNMKLLKVKDSIATIGYHAEITALPADNTTDISGLTTAYDLKGTQTGFVNINITNGFISNGNITQTLKGTVKMKRQKPAASIEIPVELTINIKQKNIPD